MGFFPVFLDLTDRPSITHLRVKWAVSGSIASVWIWPRDTTLNSMVAGLLGCWVAR